jgi:hypothetical protein
MHQIKNLNDVAAEVSAAHDTPESIAKRLFKDTRCGIGFTGHDRGISVAGYAEGTDAECPSHELDFPFTSEEFWAAVETADDEGCEMWEAYMAYNAE